MANPERGERAVTICGKEYTIRLTFNDIAEADAVLPRNVLTIISEVEERRVGLHEVRELLFRAARGQHGLSSAREAGDLLSRDPAAFGAVVAALFAAANEAFAPKADAEGN